MVPTLTTPIQHGTYGATRQVKLKKENVKLHADKQVTFQL